MQDTSDCAWVMCTAMLHQRFTGWVLSNVSGYFRMYIHHDGIYIHIFVYTRIWMYIHACLCIYKYMHIHPYPCIYHVCTIYRLGRVCTILQNHVHLYRIPDKHCHAIGGTAVTAQLALRGLIITATTAGPHRYQI